MIMLVPADALRAIHRMRPSDRPSEATAMRMWLLADQALAHQQDYSHAPKYEGQRVFWHRGDTIITGYVSKLTGVTWRPARVRSNGRFYVPVREDYCDDTGQRATTE